MSLAIVNINDSFYLNQSILKSNQTIINNTKPIRPWDFGEITLLMLVIFGAVTNLLTIIVMRSKRMRNSNASLFVICVAVSDFLLLFLKFTANMIKLYRISIYNLCILIQVIPQAATFISIWLIIIISAERCTAVIVPLQVTRIFSSKRCKLMIIFMIIFFILLSSTIGICIEYSEQQPYYCKIKGKQNGTCFYYYTFIFPWIRSSMGSWIPSIIGICLNLIIIYSLYKASSKRKSIAFQSKNNQNQTNRICLSQSVNINNLNEYRNNSIPDYKNLKMIDLKRNNRYSSLKIDKKLSMNKNLNNTVESQSDMNSNNLNQTITNGLANSKKKERQITIMLLTISVSFILLTLPYSTFELLRKLGFNSKWLKNRNLLRVVMLLIDINHATNFILYCLTAQRFRNELKIIILNLFKFNNKDTYDYSKRTSSFVSIQQNHILNQNNKKKIKSDYELNLLNKYNAQTTRYNFKK